MSPQSEHSAQGERSPVHEVIASRSIYEGRIVTMRVDEITLPRGGTATRVVVEHPGAVVMIAIDHADNVYLVRQYRHAIGKILLELPAGTLEAQEDPLEAAKRELREEVGATAGDWRRLGSFYSSPGFVNEYMDVFLARDLTIEASDPDYDEDLEVVSLPLSDLLEGRVELLDAKSLAALRLLDWELRRS